MDNPLESFALSAAIVLAVIGLCAVVMFFSGNYIDNGTWDCTKVEIINGSAECVTYERVRK